MGFSHRRSNRIDDGRSVSNLVELLYDLPYYVMVPK